MTVHTKMEIALEIMCVGPCRMTSFNPVRCAFGEAVLPGSVRLCGDDVLPSGWGVCLLGVCLLSVPHSFLECHYVAVAMLKNNTDMNVDNWLPGNQNGD